MNENYSPDLDEAPQPVHPCDYPGCPNPGEFPAPKSRHNLREYYYFCLEHVREYNKKWDFFAGFTQEQMYSQIQRDTAWERPTWPTSETIKIEEKLHDFIHKFTGKTKANVPPPKAPVTKEARALDTLGLPPGVDKKTIKSRYRELVKRYHPDKNPDNPKAADRFKIVSEAYAVLQGLWRDKQ
jgi:DnaJ-domain-containing protein 1